MDLAKIEELIHIVKDARVSELTLQSGGSSVTVKKAAGGAAQAAKPAIKKPPVEKGAKPEALAPLGVVISAPMVGIFHTTNASLQAGTAVKPGMVVGAIESMKLMSDVTAQVGGTVAEVAVEDGQPVEYGQVLFRLEPMEAESK